MGFSTCKLGAIFALICSVLSLQAEVDAAFSCFGGKSSQNAFSSELESEVKLAIEALQAKLSQEKIQVMLNLKDSVVNNCSKRELSKLYTIEVPADALTEGVASQLRRQLIPKLPVDQRPSSSLLEKTYRELILNSCKQVYEIFELWEHKFDGTNLKSYSQLTKDWLLISKFCKVIALNKNPHLFVEASKLVNSKIDPDARAPLVDWIHSYARYRLISEEDYRMMATLQAAVQVGYMKNKESYAELHLKVSREPLVSGLAILSSGKLSKFYPKQNKIPNQENFLEVFGVKVLKPCQFYHGILADWWQKNKDLLELQLDYFEWLSIENICKTIVEGDSKILADTYKEYLELVSGEPDLKAANEKHRDSIDRQQL